MRILIVEDDSRISQPVADDLRRQSHVVDVAPDGSQGLDLALEGVYDLLLLDIMIPGIDGLALCRKLRDEGEQAMIVMITARDAVSDKVAALDAGADDYLVKPLDLAELAARVRAVGRRSREARPVYLRHGRIVLDPGPARVTYDEEPVPLTVTEYAILETLMRHSRQIFTRSMLQDKVQRYGDGTSESIKTHIVNLRRKLRAAGCERDPIDTVYGSGYRLGDQ
jgi:two-component system response regulator QseB